jgi:hypothetical protein
MGQYSDKAVWILTGARWAKAENCINELHTFLCSDTLLGKINRMETCAQSNNCYEFALFCLTLLKRQNLNSN